ncbi:hypothetical protein AVEN_155591-1, partial [Araneus ventricosus]
VYDGVKIVEFTGWILDKHTVTNSETGKKEPDMHTAYRIIEDAAKAGKLSLKIKKDGQDVEYKITAIEKIEHPESIIKNSFSGVSGGLVVRVTAFCFSERGFDPRFGGVRSFVTILHRNRPTTLAGTALGLFVVGLIIGVMGYYVFLRKRNPPADYTVHLTTMKG